jgi:hypothetical protein
MSDASNANSAASQMLTIGLQGNSSASGYLLSSCVVGSKNQTPLGDFSTALALRTKSPLTYQVWYPKTLRTYGITHTIAEKHLTGSRNSFLQL